MKVVEKEIFSNQNIEKKEQVKIATTKKRDISIELVRVFACLTVIATHLCLQVYNVFDVQVDWSRLFQKCFFSDGVPLFFMITGFFLMNGRSYKKIWKSTAKKILLPSLIFVLFTQVFYLFIINKQSFIYCLKAFSIFLVPSSFISIKLLIFFNNSSK